MLRMWFVLAPKMDRVIVYAGLEKLSDIAKKLLTQPVDNFVDKTSEQAVIVDGY